MKKATDKIEVVNPYDLKVIGSVGIADWTLIDAYLNTAYELAQKRDKHIPTPERIDILKNTIKLMQSQIDDLAYLIANEGGKPLQDAQVEVARAINGIELSITELNNNHGRQIPMDLTGSGQGKLSFTYREPIGVVVAISAFNHPLNLIVHQVAPAIATGCPILVKPASDTPLSCEKFVNILYEAGLPKDWCRMVVCTNNVAEQLVTDPRIAFLSFIGSAKIGWYLKSKLAPGARCALEHGGVAPVIVDKNIDTEKFIADTMKAGFYHSGQVCVSTQKIFVPKAQVDDYSGQLASAASELQVGNAINPKVDCGPLIRPSEVTRVANWVDEAISEGAQKVCGGTSISTTCYQPTVLKNVLQASKLSNLEIFGPVICIYGYDDLDEVINTINSKPYAFQAAVYSTELGFIAKTTTNIHASAVMVNDSTAFRVDWMPFAGRKHSGYGTGGIGYTMHDMTEAKQIIIKDYFS